MALLRRMARSGTTAVALLALGACANTGGLGNVLGGILGGSQQSGQVSGVVEGVDARTQQIAIQQANGQTVGLSYDNQTQVVYQNQNYPVTSLERGDQVTARVQSSSTGTTYYTDLVQVDQSVSGGRGGVGSGPVYGSGTVQLLQGTVRQIDVQNGWFSIDAGNYSTLTVSLPYNPSRADINRFQNLRPGDSVRLYGVFLNNSRVELRQFT